MKKSKINKEIYLSKKFQTAILYILLGFFMMISCKSDDNSVTTDSTSTDTNNRTFFMGFTSWSYGPTLEAVNATYSFIENNADIYAEHIDNAIPWNAWMNNLPLPSAFENDIQGKVNRKIPGKKMLLSISILNSNRDELADDVDGMTPNYTNLNDEAIENAYVKHVDYLVSNFAPDYLVIAIEVNELRLRSPEKWNAYTLLMQNVKTRIKQLYPTLPISESISLHNLFEPEITNPTAYINEMTNYMNQHDFVAISFYPFFKNQQTSSEFQEAFDFLHERINKPIAFVETSHLAENLSVPNLNLSIPGNETGQNLYLTTLLQNATQQQYEFIIWWAHRDYDALWETFPDEIKDIGQLWRDTGLLNENGVERMAKNTWNQYFNP